MTGSEFRSETVRLEARLRIRGERDSTAGAAYVVRAMVVQVAGLDAAGLYHAAGLSAGFT